MNCVICNKREHYKRFLIWGDPFYVDIRNKIWNKQCNICGNDVLCKGLCSKHYANERYKVNFIKHIKSVRKWQKLNPEKEFKYSMNHFEKYGKYFNLSSMEYLYALQLWSKLVKKLDNFMCKNCDSTENLNAHHIMPKNDFPELSLDLSNGVTLCKKCHEEIHGFIIYRGKP